jgi:hypothetical protein
MFEAADPFVVGSEILDIGSRKAEQRQREQLALNAGESLPLDFAVPPVANVRLTFAE